MTPRNPPSPPARPPLGRAFWIIFALPLVLLLAAIALANTQLAVVPLCLAGLSMLFSPLYCGFQLAARMTEGPVAQVFLGLGLALGMGLIYPAIFFAGCMASL